MIKQLEKYRYKLLLFFLVLFLTVPAFIKPGIYEIILMICLTFIFIQSLWVFTDSRKHLIRGTIVVMVLVGFGWFSTVVDPTNIGVIVARMLLYVGFFSFTLVALFRMIIKSPSVTLDVVVVSIAIYLIMGIIGGSLAYLIFVIYPQDAFNLPASLHHNDLLDFTYFGFVTMSTLGYGDITPIRQESQALSYFLAIAGQMYVAIIIAMIVSKYISRDRKAS